MNQKPFLTIPLISALITVIITCSIYFPLFNFYSDLCGKFNRSLDYFPETFISALENHLNSPFENKNFIILGSDKRDDALEKNEKTDTIIFASLNIPQKKLSLLSLPRDLWFNDTQTKINAIYELSKETTGQVDYSFIKNKYSNLLGQNIDRVVVIDTADLVNFVRLIDGVDLYLEKGFVDNQYPNPEYIAKPSPNIPIYKTVEFPSGPVHLDITNVNEFVRSRKGSDDPKEGGTDLGRIERQQLLINAIAAKLNSGHLSDINMLSSLYNFYHQNIESDINDKFVVQLLLSLKTDLNNIYIQKIDIPTSLSDSKNAILYHPQKFQGNQWVFMPSDPSYEQLKHFISASLNDDN